MPVSERSAVPVLEMVKSGAALLPTFTLPKLKGDAGETADILRCAHSSAAGIVDSLDLRGCKGAVVR